MRRLLWILLIGLWLGAPGRLIARHDDGTIAGLAEPRFRRRWPSSSRSLVFVGGSVLVLFRERFSQALEAALFWVVVALVLAVGYTYRFELRDVADRVMAEFMPGRAATARAHGRDRARPRRRLPGRRAGQRRARADGARHRRERRRADPGGRQGRRACRSKC